MLVVTQNLKAHMVKEFGLKADATEEAFRSAVSDALVSGKMTIPQVKELTAEVAGLGDKVKSLVAAELAPMTAQLDSILKALNVKGGDGAQTAPAAGSGASAASEAEAEALRQKAIGDLVRGTGPVTEKAAGSPNPAEIMNAGAGTGVGAGSVRVKSVIEGLRHNPTAATYAFSSREMNKKAFGGSPVMLPGGPTLAGRSLDMPTERTKAMAGAWLKRMCIADLHGKPIPFWLQMNDMEKALVDYMAHECRFVGPSRGKAEDVEGLKIFEAEKLSDHWRKSLLDDSTSGGLEAVPIEFDDVAILEPLLNGEIFPLVTMIPVTRRRIEGFSMANPTLSWGPNEGTMISPFNTDGFVSAFDNSIYPITGMMRIGRDFRADSPTNIGDLIMQQYGESFQKNMDDTLATGDGVTQPSGLFTTLGHTAVISDNGTAGPPTVDDYLSLLFGVSKQNRGPRCVYVSNQTSYQRSRGIQVAPGTDQRLVLGMNVEAYMTFDRPHRVNDSIPNGSIGFFDMAAYRLYRRQGYTVRVVTEDLELARSNEDAVIIRARFGGAMTRASAGAKTTNAQS